MQDTSGDRGAAAKGISFSFKGPGAGATKRLARMSAAPAPDRASILQERLELWCEDRVAVIDRVLPIADQ
jgi:hypothetical protein